MATRPELHIAVAKTKSKASEYNENFTMMMGYVEDSMEEFMPSVTGNSGKVLTTNGTTTSWSDAPTALLQTIYPIGSIYIGTMSTCPLASLFGTWEKKGAGRVLQGSDETHEAGTTIAAGLPNIKGTFTADGPGDAHYIDQTVYDGALVRTSPGARAIWPSSLAGDWNKAKGIQLNANRHNSIYSDSVSTVQPPAFVVNIWERTA